MNTTSSEFKAQKERLFNSWATLNKRRTKVRQLMNEHTRFVDSILINTLKEKLLNPSWCVVALGSYGRKQMNPYSDVDIMILTNRPDEEIETISREIYDTFYTLGYEISVVTRTVEECVELSKTDDVIKTSMFDHRLICGNSKTYEAYEDAVREEIIGNNIYEFINKKTENLKKRHAYYGNTVFVLEPNVKEGVGGIRDYHTLLWMGKAWFSTKNILEMRNKGILDEEDYTKIRSSLYFLWQLRNALHLLSGRKNDVLYIDNRSAVADMLGFPKTDTEFKDRLMRKYYHYSGNLHRIVNKYIDMFNNTAPSSIKPDMFFLNSNIHIRENRISILKAEDLSPLDTFEVFYYSSLYNTLPEESLLEKFRGTLKKEAWKIREDRFINFLFKSMLSLKAPVSAQIRKMHESTVLDKFIPEFGNTYCLTESSLYHKYTVDEHSIQALEHIDKLLNLEEGSNFTMRLKEILLSLEPHDVMILRLSILLHDIGKVKTGKHTEIGATLCKPIAKRMDLGEDLTEKLVFLVKNHLVMNRIISKNDVYSTSVIEKFASLVQNSDRLNLLTLMTYADMNAVNDNVWTTWKEDLVDDLYTNTMRFFEHKNYTQYVSMIAKQSKKKLIIKLGTPYKSIISSLPPEILTDENRDFMEDFIKHLPDKSSFVSVYKTGLNLSKVFVYYRDEFGFFNKISGILTCLDVNILRGKSYSLENGMIIDVFTVTSETDINPESIGEILTEVQSGTTNLDECVSKKRKTFLSRLQRAKLNMSLDKTRVKINNKQSDIFTVIRVYAPDRIGLLYDITKVFSSFNLMVGMFMLDTKGELAIDTFYVSTRSGKKIFSTTLLDMIKNKILEVIYK